MATTEPQRDLEQLARLAAEVYERQVQPALRPEDDGKFVAVDIRTGQYELDEDDYAAVMRLHARCPSAEVWLERVGQRAAHRMRLRGRSNRREIVA
jgi:hypothetical protein